MTDIKRCPKCGDAVLWLRGHVCRVGPVEKPAKVEKVVPKPGVVAKTPLKKKSGTGYERLKRWRGEHPEEHRRRHREYMRKWKAR